jgi:carboxypeptidase Q
LPEQGNISVYFNLDNGTGKIRGIYLQNNEKVRDIFNAWLQPFASVGATGITSNSVGGGTDHFSFEAVGIPAFQFIQDPMDYDTRTHHTNMDVYDHLSIEDLKQSATIVAAFVYNAAIREDMSPRKPLTKPERLMFENGYVRRRYTTNPWLLLLRYPENYDEIERISVVIALSRGSYSSHCSNVPGHNIINVRNQ